MCAQVVYIHVYPYLDTQTCRCAGGEGGGESGETVSALNLVQKSEVQCKLLPEHFF